MKPKKSDLARAAAAAKRNVQPPRAAEPVEEVQPPAQPAAPGTAQGAPAATTLPGKAEGGKVPSKPVAALLNEAVEVLGAKPGLAAELGWGESIMKATTGDEVRVASPAQEAAFKTVALVGGSVAHHAGGAEAVKAKLREFVQQVKAARRTRLQQVEDQHRAQQDAALKARAAALATPGGGTMKGRDPMGVERP